MFKYPGKESDHGSTSTAFIELSEKEMPVADLCRGYGISRPTGYRWINRYNETGPEEVCFPDPEIGEFNVKELRFRSARRVG